MNYLIQVLVLRWGEGQSGSKNPIQQIKSTITYLKIATYEAVTGIASTEGNVDDDGNGSGSETKYITEDQALKINALIDDNNLDKEAWLKYSKIEHFNELEAHRFGSLMKRINERLAIIATKSQA
ncbi:hypothetical protein [Candidatus Vondammii sp. HM_W22]|uniref:hypothetical protein n=1 Tax=Candidatus Vondammii sp. HM_W22 TaxID=2687299 RepID=UPI001F12A64A|nr:hypothetical protein [Candidatus Vondammii sp. HM_W22]